MQAYFPFEGKIKQQCEKMKSKSEKALFTFLKDYDICPALLTKSSAFLLFNEVLEKSVDQLCNSPFIRDLVPYFGNDIGTIFTFYKFCVYLIRIGSICYTNIYTTIENK